MDRPLASFASTCALAAALLTGGRASADAWVNRPLVLPPLHFAGDVGVGVAASRSTTGIGASMEATVGLGLGFEFGLRSGFRHGDAGLITEPDRAARLYDLETYDFGGASFSNPEVRLRDQLLSAEVVAVALETRVYIPASAGSDLAIMPGLPVRVHIPSALRVDTGAFLPVVFQSTSSYGLDIPAALWIPIGDVWFGPMASLQLRQNEPVRAVAGVGVGYTIARVLDLKAQIVDHGPALFDSPSVGVGVGINLP